MKIAVGDKYITRNYGCSQNDRDAATSTNTPLIMTPCADILHTVTRVTPHNVWLTNETDHSTIRVDRHILTSGLYHGHTIGHTTALYGPYEAVNETTTVRSDRWSRSKLTAENMDAVRFALAKESVGAN